VDRLHNFITDNQKVIIYFLLGIILVGLGVLAQKTKGFTGSNKVEVLDNTTVNQNTTSEIVVEISGAVEKPGVYKLFPNARIDDLLIAAGGISADADRDWISKNVNRAAKLTDGQKLYIYHLDDTAAKSDSYIKQNQVVLGQSVGGLVNINSASLTELDKLPGIGQVYGQNIIEHRPYSNIEELVSKGVLKQSVFEKIKNQITLY
jgi:competence protein ComEA